MTRKTVPWKSSPSPVIFLRMPKHSNRRRGALYARKGSAVAECAIVLPIIFLLAFSTLEICSALFLRQTATTIAYEGARLGVRGKTARQTVIDECNSLLTARGIVNGTVNVTPTDFSTIEELDPVTVSIQAPYRGNTWFLWNLFQNGNLQVSVTMAREYGN